MPLEPAACSVTPIDKGTIRISITKNSGSEVTGYRVTYRDEESNTKTVSYTGEGPHDKIITGLTPGTNYTFSTVSYTDGVDSTACSDAGQTCKSENFLANMFFY